MPELSGICNGTWVLADDTLIRPVEAIFPEMVNRYPSHGNLLQIYKPERTTSPMSTTTSTLTPPQQSSSSTGKTFTAKAFAAQNAKSGLAATSIPRRDPRPQDVQIEILYCGVCHSDLHTVRNECESMMPTIYPCFPGHTMLGRLVNPQSAV